MNDAPFFQPPHCALVTEPMNAHTATAYEYTRVVASRRSALQQIEVLDTPAYGRVLRIDGTTMTSEADEFFYHENLVHVPAVAHARPVHGAIIGGGDGGALREMLKHACLETATVIEIDPAVVEISSRYLPGIHQGAFRDPRTTLEFGDGREWLSRQRQPLDLLLMDLTDPTGAAHALYTDEFYSLCRARLAPAGVLGLHVQSPVARPRTFTRIVRTLQSVFRHVRPYFIFVPTYGTWFGMATASMELDPLADTAEGLCSRLEERNLGKLKYYNASTHYAGFALPNFVAEHLRADVPLVSSGAPRLDEDPEFQQWAGGHGERQQTAGVAERCPAAV